MCWRTFRGGYRLSSVEPWLIRPSERGKIPGIRRDLLFVSSGDLLLVEQDGGERRQDLSGWPGEEDCRRVFRSPRYCSRFLTNKGG